MRKIYTTLILLLSANIMFAQSYDDLLRFSRISPDGTARSAAMGGAFGALGGDISTLGINPAGIGVFRKSEFSFTPLMNFNTIKSGLRESDQNRFLVGNIGAAFSFYTPRSEWRSINFGLSYNNLNNFNNTMYQVVENSESSQTHAYAVESGQKDISQLDDFMTKPAYNAYLTYFWDDNHFYESALYRDGKNELVNQYKQLKEDGYQGEYDFSIGANYKDQLYLGFTIGVQTISYTMNSVYTEIGEEQAASGFDSYDFFEYKKIDAAGTNLKFGLIYRPIPEFRLGAAIHTPTWFSGDYTHQTDISSYFQTPYDDWTGRDKDQYHVNGGYSRFDFNFRTPWRMILSAAGVFLQKGIISFDYEYVDYGSAKFTNASDNYDYFDTNQALKESFKAAHNFRIGAEYRLNSVFSLRAGYGIQANPHEEEGFSDVLYVNAIPRGKEIQSISGGIGLNFGTFYCDAAYTNKSTKDKTIFYYAEGESDGGYKTVMAEPVKNKYKDNQVRLTFGFRF